MTSSHNSRTVQYHTVNRLSLFFKWNESNPLCGGSLLEYGSSWKPKQHYFLQSLLVAENPKIFPSDLMQHYYYYLSSDDQTGLESILAIQEQTSVAIK